MKTTKLLAYVAAGLQLLVLAGMLILTFSQKSLLSDEIVKELGKGVVFPLYVILPACLVLFVCVGYAIVIQFTGMYNKAAKSAVGIGMLVLMIMVQCINPYLSGGLLTLASKIAKASKIAAYSQLNYHMTMMLSPVSAIAIAMFYTACGSYLKTSVMKAEDLADEIK